ncbi:DUF3177 family protein [Prochlorothrix hollandica]|uniref:DUF3177 domain-containing protein n=1 Tax=Prochlorothrix hollandica PCC 9006 = CALU 1027 TaxID=317619 RepID=A0A0M2PZG4_PROHO|nr:DUF3177 family protein [Prochlorothrix hollandica]KKJ01550.1 hypothetical protein PROH_04430 [Prochlorothrix hollandica PCC 9006 = CALU 1027]
MTDFALSALVWADYRLAVLFTVSLPLLLLIWAFISKMDAIQRLLEIYWKVSSLLAITVFLFIAAIPLGFVTGWLARLLIPISLWFWVDLNEDIHDMLPQRPLKIAFNSWRWGVTVYSVLGSLLSLGFVRCAGFSQDVLLTEDTSCRLWLEPPWGFRDYFMAGQTPDFVGFLGAFGLLIYTAYLVYFLVIRLGRQGRSAIR